VRSEEWQLCCHSLISVATLPPLLTLSAATPHCLRCHSAATPHSVATQLPLLTLSSQLPLCCHSSLSQLPLCCHFPLSQSPLCCQPLLSYQLPLCQVPLAISAVCHSSYNFAALSTHSEALTLYLSSRIAVSRLLRCRHLCLSYLTFAVVQDQCLHLLLQ